MECPKCGGLIITSRKGEQYCSVCGYVINKPTLRDYREHTMIPVSLPSKYSLAIERALSIVDEYGLNRYKFKRKLWDVTKMIAGKIDEYHAMPVVLALVYYLIRQMGYPLSLREYMKSVEARNVSKKAFIRSLSKIQNILGKLAPTNPFHFLTHYLSLLWNSEILEDIQRLPGGMSRLRKLARTLLRDIPHQSIMGRRPSLVAAAAIYHAIKALSIELGYSRSVVSEQKLAKVLDIPRYSFRDTVIYLSSVIPKIKNK